MKKLNLYYCQTCKNLIEVVNSNPTVKLQCCGKDMNKIGENTTDGATEKHLPIVNIEENSLFIQVGEVIHPMTDEHYISAIYVIDDLGNYEKVVLTPYESPEVSVDINEKAKKVNVYSYCNLHGLWKTEIDL